MCCVFSLHTGNGGLVTSLETSFSIQSSYGAAVFLRMKSVLGREEAAMSSEASGKCKKPREINTQGHVGPCT